MNTFSHILEQAPFSVQIVQRWFSLTSVSCHNQPQVLFSYTTLYFNVIMFAHFNRIIFAFSHHGSDNGRIFGHLRNRGSDSEVQRNLQRRAKGS
jgi:hypothetical protein